MNRSESGFTTVFVAISLVGLLGASAVALDLGQGFTSRRQMANSADAAAYAGARALMKSRSATTGIFSDPSQSVWTTTRDTAVNNGADLAQVTCKVVTRTGTDIADCSSTGLTGWPLSVFGGGPAGVKVTVAVTNNTAFGKVLNQSTLTARATATAVMAPLISAKGAPFIVCGYSDKSMSVGQWPYDTTTDPTTGVVTQNNHDIAPQNIDMLLPASSAINPLAVGHIYGVQGGGNAISTCNTNAAFDGKSADGTTAIELPSWQTGTNGNGNDAAVYDTVAGVMPCKPGIYTDCDLILPIADSGATNYQLHVVAMGLFHVSGDGTGNPKYAGRLWVADAPVTKGEVGSGVCTFGAICKIQLIS